MLSLKRKIDEVLGEMPAVESSVGTSSKKKFVSFGIIKNEGWSGSIAPNANNSCVWTTMANYVLRAQYNFFFVLFFFFFYKLINILEIISICFISQNN